MLGEAVRNAMSLSHSRCDTQLKRVKSGTFLHRIQHVPNKYFQNFTQKTCIHSISFDFRYIRTHKFNLYRANSYKIRILR